MIRLYKISDNSFVDFENHLFSGFTNHKIVFDNEHDKITVDSVDYSLSKINRELDTVFLEEIAVPNSLKL